MRDVLVTLAFIALAFKTLQEPWIGAMLWTLFSLLNPHRLTYGFAFTLPFAAVAAGVCLISVMIHRNKVRLPADPAVVLLLAFVVWTGITTAFAIHAEESFTVWFERLVKVQLMTLVCLMTLRTRKHIEMFVWVIVVSLGFYAVKGGIFAIATGGSSRVWGPGGTFIEDNNALGLAIVMTIPLMNYLRVVSRRMLVRRGLLAAMLLSSVAVLSSQSRGAFLAIAAMGFVLWMRAKSKLLGGIVIVAVGISLLAFMPASWEARMQTIGSYQQDASAMGRINAWQTAANVANDRITGAGFAIDRADVFGKYAPNPDLVLTAHSIYFQVLGEHGWPGLILFLSMGAVTFWHAMRLRAAARARPETEWLRELAGMIQVSMVGYATGGAFLSLAYFDLPYYIMVITLAGKYWLRDECWRTDTVGAFGAGMPQLAKPAVNAVPKQI